MAYSAYINNTIFFSTESPLDELALSDARLSMRANSAGEFNFLIPPTNACYNSFHLLTDYIDVYRDTDLIFSGRVYSITERLDAQRRICCEGLLAMLNDSVLRPVEYSGTVRNLFTALLANHDAQVEYKKVLAPGSLTITDSAAYRDYQNHETTIIRMRDLVDSFGGYMYVSGETGIAPSVVDVAIVDVGIVDVGPEGIRHKLNWVQDFTTGCSQVIELTSNLINITKEETSDGIVTILIPTGAVQTDGSKVTISSVNGGLDYIVAGSAYIAQYGYIVGTQSWRDVNDPSTLKTRAQDYLTEILTPKMTIELTAVDLADAGYSVDAFCVGQKITVNSDTHGINNVQFNCQEQMLDLLHPDQNRLTLGTTQARYTNSQMTFNKDVQYSIGKLEKDYTPRSILQSAIDAATTLITGNDGGYVVLHDSDGDTFPDEILIMDTPDINTAVRVWRWNQSGLGYSSTGYNGTFGLAMTINGQIVADFITAGTLSGNRVRTGLIESEDQSSSWNLDTGVLTTANAVFTSSIFTNGTINCGNTFTVDAQGNVVANSLTATGATITGTVKSDAGIIGGWNIHDGYMDYTMSGTHIYLYGGTYIDGTSVVQTFEQQSNAYWTTPSYTPIMAFSSHGRLTLDGDIIVRDIYLEGSIHTEATSNVAGLSYTVVSTF